MSDRLVELEARQRLLQARCAAQRSKLGRQVTALEARFGTVDRAAGFARSTLRNPGVIVAVVAAFLAIGRARGLRLMGRIMLLTTAARRLMWLVRYL